MVDQLLDFVFVCVDEDDHRDDYPFDFLPAVAPVVDFILDWNVIGNAQGCELSADGLFCADLNEGRNPTFRVRYALVSPIDRRFKSFIKGHCCLFHINRTKIERILLFFCYVMHEKLTL